MNNDFELKVAFQDIINGFSVLKNSKYGKIFIKHTDSKDSANISSSYKEFYDRAIANDIPSEETKKEFLKREKLWSDKQDREIFQLESFVRNLYKTKSLLSRTDDINVVKKQIMEEEQSLLKLKIERETLMGFTAEKFANKKINDFHIIHSLFRDNEFKTPIYNNEDFEYLDDIDINDLLVLYSGVLELFNNHKLKKIAISPFFTNFFYLCNDNPQIFYGVPVVKMTFFQMELFGYGRYFKNITSSFTHEPPDDIAQDPDKLIEWYEQNKNAQKNDQNIDTNKDGASGKVGMTKEDFKRLGYNMPTMEQIDEHLKGFAGPI